ncbi:MAG: hypothetical protein IJF40_02905 [Clostridia bacterium]|nr:hypothetical protein [Clostridia bacterium]
MKKKIYSVCALLIALAMVFSFAACDSLKAEEETTEPPIISKTPMPTNDEAALNYFNGLINAVKAAKPGTLYEQTNKDVSDAVCGEEDGERNELIENAFPFLKKYILQSAESVETKYGEDLTEKFPIAGQTWSSKLTAADIKSAACVENEDNYELTIILNDEINPTQAGVHGKAFNIPTDADRQAILKEFQDKMKDYITISGIESLTYTECQIFCVIERETDKLISVEYSRNVKVGTTITGVGTLENMGPAPCSFTYKYAEKYSFDWTDPNAPTTEAAE